MRYIFSFLFCLSSLVGKEFSYFNAAQKIQNLFDAVESNQITTKQMLLDIEELDLELLLKPSLVDGDNLQSFAKGQGVCSGAVQGVLCFDLKHIEDLKAQNSSIIWVTDHIENDHLCYLKDIAGIFAFKEDPSSHAVIVTRVHNIPCITFPEDAVWDGGQIISSLGVLKEGDLVTIDAFNGKLYKGSFSIHYPEDTKLLDRVMECADQHARLIVHGSVDTAQEAKQAMLFGAKGADPRTEHMFFSPQSLKLFRKAVICDQESPHVLQELQALQKKDFIDLYSVMKSNPVKIRLLDPPLHEFLPTEDQLIQEIADELGISYSQLNSKIQKLEELNPMMGHRGIRLLLTYPHILRMQVNAIFEAALDSSVSSYAIEPHIILPMVISHQEVVAAKKIIDEVYQEVCQVYGKTFTYHLGAMIETPRACLLARTIAPYVDFISFGTNDLTGQTLALSRGDVYEKFLKFYFDQNILESDPFANLDPAVCELIKITVDQMREQDHYVTIGLCGEQGSGKQGVFKCHQLGLDTVTCSAFRLPAVKLFAAQAAILDESHK